MTQAGYENNIQWIQWKHSVLASKVAKHVRYYGTDCDEMFLKLKTVTMMLDTLWRWSYVDGCNNSCLTEAQICALIDRVKKLVVC